jgi:hypothetical protein
MLVAAFTTMAATGACITSGIIDIPDSKYVRDGFDGGV